MGSGGDGRPGGGDDGAGGIGGRDGVLAALRVALVLVLLGLAAHGLSGRRGLDWSRLTQRPATPVLAVVLLGAAAVVVVLVLLTVRQLLRAAAAAGGPDEDEPLPEARRLSPWAYLAAALVFALVGLLVYTAVRYALPVDQAATDPGRSGSEAPGADPGRLLGGLSLTGALLAAVTVALLLGLRAASRRPGPATDAEQGAAVDDRREPTAEPLAGAVTAAQEQLAAHGDDVRTAIIAAYSAMEEQLALAGTPRQRSDTPTDLLKRAVAAGRVTPGPAGKLTELFREARYSSHPMPGTARRDAARALARVARDLAGHRV